MKPSDHGETPAGRIEERFRGLQKLTNHWARPFAPRRYYWYLTFENSPALKSAIKVRQEEISFPYYDLVPLDDLHLTLDRIAFERDVSPEEIRTVEAAAEVACRTIAPLNIDIDHFGGTSGAVGLNASPLEKIKYLRDTLRGATLSIFPSAPIKDAEFSPHVAVAYCNTDGVPATQIHAAADKLNMLPAVEVTVREASLVILERRSNSYVWNTISRIALGG